MECFLGIEDIYSSARMEWVLGVAVLQRNFSRVENINSANYKDDRK